MLLVLLLQFRDELVVSRSSGALQILRPPPIELSLGGSTDEGIPLLHEGEIGGIELLGLDQDLLAHADLAEVVEQAGVADLA